MTQDLRQLLEDGRAAFERRNFADALAAFREVLESNPDFADVRHLTGLCLSFLGQPEAALVQFEEALRLNPAYAEAHLNRALVLTELGRYEEAQRSFLDAGRFETETQGPFPALISARLANAHMSLGDLYTEAGAPVQAAEQYRAALSMRPRFHDIRNKLAESLMRMGDLAAAQAELEAVLRENPRFLAARLNLGLLHFRRGELEPASAEWELCRREQPGHPQVRAFLTMLERQSSSPRLPQ